LFLWSGCPIGPIVRLVRRNTLSTYDTIPERSRQRDVARKQVVPEFWKEKTGLSRVYSCDRGQGSLSAGTAKARFLAMRQD